MTQKSTVLFSIKIRPVRSWGLGIAEWLRRCSTSRTVPGSIAGGVTGFFSDIPPSDHTMALGSIQALVKINTRYVPVGKGGRCVRLQPHHFHVPNVMKYGSLNHLEPSGPHRACYGIPLPLRAELFLAEGQTDGQRRRT